MKKKIKYKNLELFRDFGIYLSDLNENGTIDLFNSKSRPGRVVVILPEHVITALTKYRKNEITLVHLLEWIYTTRFTDLFRFPDAYHESILGVFEKIQETNLGHYVGTVEGTDIRHIDIMSLVNDNVLATIDLAKIIGDKDIDRYVRALCQNQEI